jgi:4-amino-4-deoxy-L-arabinose transferase-like glycosyltransferase
MLRNIQSIKIGTQGRWALAGVVAICLGFMLVLAYASANGPYGFSDSVAYLVSARNLLRGVGLGYYFPDGRFQALVHHPPAYPLAVALAALGGGNLLARATVLGFVIAGLTVAAAGLIIARFGKYPGYGLLTAFMMCIFPPMIRGLGSLMSEGLFLCLWLWGTYALLSYLTTGNRTRWLVAAAVLLGLTPLARYVGIALIPAAALSLFVLLQGNWKMRAGRTLLFTALAALPTASWLLWTYTRTEEVAGRTRQFALGGLRQQIVQFGGLAADTLSSWVPFRAQAGSFNRAEGLAIVLGAVLLAAILTALAARKLARTNLVPATQSGDLKICVAFSSSAAFYATGLAGAFLFTLPTPDVSSRTLLPLYVAAMMALIAAWALWQQAWLEKARWAGVVPLAIGALLVAGWAAESGTLVDRLHLGEGYFTHAWRDSETMEAIRELPRSVPVVSNQAAAVLFWADRPAYEMMETMPSSFGGSSAIYGSDPGDASQEAFRKGARLAIFTNGMAQQMQSRFGSPGSQHLETMLDGALVWGRFEDGVIYLFRK